MGSVRTSILGRPRPLSRDRRASPTYTLNCEEPLCGGQKERFERGKVCRPCRPWLRYAASLRQFGLTPAEYVAIFNAQGGRCYVCGAPPQRVRLCIDHDHSIPETRRAIRGLLCGECNYNRLPRFQDNAVMLRNAANYLIDPPAQTVLSALPSGLPAPPSPEGLVFFPEVTVADDRRLSGEASRVAGQHHGASRPGEPPVGSQRRPGTRGEDLRGLGREQRSRRRKTAGEVDG
ncbi:endonuclease domain-containing protein [Blastococcus capsensis]|uniref:endonuclease domain-containing protein n=1 Tax=Blastococcus capsensis TaxID=1564163 RepID=UPI003D6BDD8F